MIAATNASLEELVEQGHFREDLYYRLNVVPIVLPPLRERREDIPLLTQFFVKRYADQNKIVPAPGLTPEVLTALKMHDWPGNVRELENAIERMIVLSGDGPLQPDFLKLDRVRISAQRQRERDFGKYRFAISDSRTRAARRPIAAEARGETL